MLAECAEAQAIRKGWPEDLSNAFVGEEIEQAGLNLHPAQEAAVSVQYFGDGAQRRSSRRPPVE